MPTVTIAHDAFGRTELVRKVEAGDCSWCGGKRPNGKAFRYGVRSDDSLSGRTHWDKRTYCCIDCRREGEHS